MVPPGEKVLEDSVYKVTIVVVETPLPKGSVPELYVFVELDNVKSADVILLPELLLETVVPSDIELLLVAEFSWVELSDKLTSETDDMPVKVGL